MAQLFKPRGYCLTGVTHYEIIRKELHQSGREPLKYGLIPYSYFHFFVRVKLERWYNT